MKPKTLVALLLCYVVGTSFAEETRLDVNAAWARPTPPGARTGAVYLTLHNPGDAEVAVVGVSAPVADMAEIHRTVMKGEMTGMVPVAGLVVAPGQTIALEPGGLHIMLLHLHQVLAEGEQFSITLKFMDGGEQAVDVPVHDAAQKPSD